MKRVLVVDDEPEIVEMVCMVLEGDEIELLGAYDGEEALLVIQEHHPDVVLSDVMMPRLNGCELSKRIRSDSSCTDTVVILMSAGRGIDLTQSGASELIHKPFDLSDLATTVQGYLSADRGLPLIAW